ncbi:MAG: hypothetical protein B7Z73_05535 [Planctomycetia bacterium 21-64-5]|nr:MAG: hypothetical protein B7Z73_05535 [Planctomycetia bacterium 21-64-5]HQU43243.1 hypothetical protein [Pirellulales bacterium]HVA45066.1 hypothetical protein [Pirellulales bacterium]
MTEANFKKSLQAFIRRRPFKPFEVELVSGDRFVVEHPEALAHGGAVAVYISTEGDVKLFDSSSVSQLMDIADRQSA